MEFKNISIYFHWPFCESKCPYCDFNSHVRKEINHRQWLLGYLINIENWKKKLPHSKIQSVYFGGGTPSLMNPKTISIILENLYKHLPPVWEKLLLAPWDILLLASLLSFLLAQEHI